MASAFLASALSASFNPDITINAQEASEQKGVQLVSGRHTTALQPPWQRGIRIFNSKLTKDESKKLALDSFPKASLESFLQEAASAKENATRKRSKGLDRINAILQRINMFSSPINTLSQANQEFQFAWGTLKFLMQVVISEKEIADKLAEAVADVMQIFGRCEQYTQLYASYDRLLEAIGVLYADVLNLLVRATRFYQKGGIKRFMTATITPFEVKFAPIVSSIQTHGAVVENEAQLAHTQEQQVENNLQRNFRSNMEANQVDKLSKEVKLWLQPSDSTTDWRKLQELQLTGTCSWLTGKTQYLAWSTVTDSSILWIYGIPGSGKSVLASNIIDRLRTNSGESKVPLIYFFCSGRNENRRISTHVLRSLVFQLQIQCPSLTALVQEAYKASTTRAATSFDELWSLFRSMVRKTSTICVIDGLDECQDRDEDGNLERSAFAHHLVELATEQRSDAYFKVLLTSRNEPDLRVAFHSITSLVRTISISPSDVSNDIHVFIASKIESSHQLSDLSAEMRNNIVAKLDSNASGMFIWARLMIEELERRDSEETLEEALEALPGGLSALYDQILCSLTHNFDRNEAFRDLGGFILSWAVHGSRPLTLSELSEARCIKPGQSSLSSKRKPRSLISFRRLIEASCGPLVEVHDDGLVQLAHHTTKEYLLENSERLFRICNPSRAFGLAGGSDLNTQTILSQVCLSYLRLELFGVPLLGVRKRFHLKSASDVRLLHPFLEYAASNWLFHLNHSECPPLLEIHRFIHSPQAITWIETIITLQGSIEQLATNIQFLTTISSPALNPVSEAGHVGVKEWLESLQRVIFDWGGTLNQTPSEIHFLDVLNPTARCPLSRAGRLQKISLLDDPAAIKPNIRPVTDGNFFILRQPYVFVRSTNFMFQRDPFLRRYHWLSMQHRGNLSLPRTESVLARVVEIQISPSETHISAIMIDQSSIIIVVWTVSDEGFDTLPWAKEDGIVSSISVKLEYRTFSHIPIFDGPGWRQSARYAAFSQDGKTIRTPTGAFDLTTGESSPVPPCCGDVDVAYATWSLYGERLACIRGKKSLEIYESDGQLSTTFQAEHIESSMIVEFSRAARYVLLLDPESWRHFIHDVHQQTHYTIPPPKFKPDENPFGSEIPVYDKHWTILEHSFSPCERYFSFLVDDLNHRQPAVLAVWDCVLKEYTCARIWSQRSTYRPSGVQFDSQRSETLHLLLAAGNDPLRGGTHGFVEINLTDETTFNELLESGKERGFTRYDLCLNSSGGRVFQKLGYTSRLSPEEEWQEKVDIISWNLSKAPPEVDQKITIPRNREGWADGYSQSNGAYSDWYMLSKDSALFIVGSRLYSISDGSEPPILLRTFDSIPAFKQLLETPGHARIDNEETKDELKELEEECFWTYFNPDGSLICFYATKEYIVIFDVESGDIRWCYRLLGKHVSDYWNDKPLFHPTRPMIAWVGQIGKDGRDDFDSLKHCGVYTVDLSAPKAMPVRFENLEVDSRTDLMFSPCGSYLYGGIIGRDDYNEDERKIKFFKIDLSTGLCINYLKAISPIKGPSYCGSPNPVQCRIVLKDGEIHFLITVEYKVMLAKIDFDNTVKWKMIASLPGPPTAPEATALSGWNGDLKDKGQSDRLDIVLAAQNFACPRIINTWDENPGEWDEVHKVEHDPTL